MADVVQFYTNPMSRGQIVRWMLEEVGADYETHVLDYASGMKDPDYLAINPMGKVPAIVHRGNVVTEGAAICAYLADAFPGAGLAPNDDEKADYYRWFFFAAGPVEAAVTNKAAGFEVQPDRERMFGYGNYERTIDALTGAVTGRDYICGSRFTAVDVYLGSQVVWGMQFGTMTANPTLEAYAARVSSRPAYLKAKDIDSALIAEMQAAAPA